MARPIRRKWPAPSTACCPAPPAPSGSAAIGRWGERLRDDREGYHLANLRFHDALVEFAGNAKLLQMYRRLVNELSLFRRHTLAEPRTRPKALARARAYAAAHAEEQRPAAAR